jgi:hypothetical protein
MCERAIPRRRNARRDIDAHRHGSRRALPEQVEAVVRHIERLGFRAHPIPGAFRTAIGITGHRRQGRSLVLENFPGVKEVIPSRTPTSWSAARRSRTTRSSTSAASTSAARHHRHRRPVRRRVARSDAHHRRGIKRAGGQLFRGGAYKPRTSPYSFQGLGEEGAGDPGAACAKSSTCRSSPRRSITSRCNSSSSTPTASRSARATCRTSRC